MTLWSSFETKVIKGEASEAETKLFAAYVKALPTNKPPKGSAESWKKLTGALAKATENHLAGKEGSAEALAKAQAITNDAMEAAGYR